MTDIWRALRRESIPRIAAVWLAILVLGGVLVVLAERGGSGPIQSIGEGLWYAIVTMLSVGYGDYTPVSIAGRLVGAAVMIGGLTVFSVFTATVASGLVARRIKEERGLETVKLHDHLLVCGWNAYGESLLEALFAAQGGHADIVLVNELPEEEISEILERDRRGGAVYVRGDPASEGALERANAKQARAAIVLTDTVRGSSGSDDRTTLVTLALKSVRPEMRVTVEALHIDSETHLRRAGADDVVVSGEFNSFLLSSAAVAPGVPQVVRPLLSRSGSELRRVAIPPEFVGRTYGELAAWLRQRDGFLAIAVVTDERGLKLDDLLSDDTSLVDHFIKDQFSEAGREFLRYEGGGTRALVNPPDSYEIGHHDSVVGIPGRT